MRNIGINKELHYKECRQCGSKHIVKAGRHRNKKGLFQIYKCQDCGTTFLGSEIKNE